MTKLEAVWTGHFEPTADSVAAVRQLVAAHLERVSAERRNVVVLVASELASNAVRHAHTPYRVELRMNGAARIAVQDRGAGVPRLQYPRPDDTGGRGLFLVSRLSARWDVEWLDDSKVVWVEVALSGDQDCR
jgi:anti-sigma regulatory factor (Ser/Thr protein kinase)